MNSQKKSMSLKVKLIALSVGITFVLGASSMGVLRHIASTQETSQFNSFEAYARSLNDAIGAQFFERYGDVQAFSINPSIRASNRQTIVDALNTYSVMYAIYDLIMVVDAKGRLVAVNSKGPDGKDISSQQLYNKNYSDAPWFKASMAGFCTDDKDKGYSGSYIEDVQVDPWVSLAFGGNRLGNSFSTAIKDPKGNTIGVITNRAGSRWFEVAFKELYAGLKKSGYPHSKAMLVGKDGTLLFQYSSDPLAQKLDDPKYDWNELLKLNLVTSGDAAAKEVTAGRRRPFHERHRSGGCPGS